MPAAIGLLDEVRRRERRSATCGSGSARSRRRPAAIAATARQRRDRGRASPRLVGPRRRGRTGRDFVSGHGPKHSRDTPLTCGPRWVILRLADRSEPGARGGARRAMIGEPRDLHDWTTRRRERLAAWLARLVIAGSLLVGCGATPPYVAEGCARGDLGGRSVARVWDDQTLELIRQVVPAPTVHARNLFHMSVGDVGRVGRLRPDRRRLPRHGEARGAAMPTSIAAARETAMSYAAYRILLWRYGTVADLATARRAARRDDGDPVLPDGLRRDRGRLARGARQPHRRSRPRPTASTDGALEDERYKDPSYTPGNEPLEVAKPGTVMARPEPLAAAGPGQADLPERPADPGPDPVLHRAALGPRDAVRAAAIADGVRRSTRVRRRWLGDATTDAGVQGRRPSTSSAQQPSSTPPTA